MVFSINKRPHLQRLETPYVCLPKDLSAPSDATPIASLKREFKKQVALQQVEVRRDPHPEFMGIKQLQVRHKAQIDQFQKWSQGNWGTFHSEHYDWWAFPICSGSQGQGYKCSISLSEIEELKRNPVFMATYRKGVRLVVQSFGWDLDAWSPVAHPKKEQRWTHNEVRLGKVAESLKLFGEWDLFQKLHYFGQKECQGASRIFKQKLLL